VTTAAIEDHHRLYSQAVMEVPAEYFSLPAIAHKCPHAKELAAPLNGRLLAIARCKSKFSEIAAHRLHAFLIHPAPY